LSAVDLLKESVGSTARRSGYKGSFPTWRKATALGDVAIVDVQQSPWSDEGTQRFALNAAVAPRPWVDWLAHMQGRNPPKQIPESFGLYRARVGPGGHSARGQDWWVFPVDADAAIIVSELCQRITSDVIPKLDALLDRQTLLHQVRSGETLGDMSRDHFPQFFARAEALLLADSTSSEMTDALARAKMFSSETPGSFIARASEFEDFVLSRAR
jgi:hypothetical protein